MYKKLIHLFIFIIFVTFFYIFFQGKDLVFGDFATTFSHNNLKLVDALVWAWLDNSFLGYETIFYVFLRIPFYLISDLINLFFSSNGYWLLFVVIYFLRYIFFFVLLRSLKVSFFTSIVISFIYSINFYFIDRLGHTLISFGSITIPTLILSYSNLVKNGISFKWLSVFMFSIWIIMSSMHVTLMTLYFGALMFIGYAIWSIKNKQIQKFIFLHIKLISVLLLIFSYIIIPIFYSTFFVNEITVVQQVSSQASDWIFNLSRYTSLFNTLSGVGYLYSEILNNKLIVWIGFFSTISTMVYVILIPKNKVNIEYYIYFITFLLFLFLSSISLLKPAIPLLKDNLIGFNSIKDNSYFILYVQLSFWILVAISIESISKRKFFIWLSRIQISVIAILFFIVNIYSFSTFNYFKTAQIPEEYYSIEQKLDKNGRVLVLPLGWVSKFEWSNGIMSGFFNLFLANYQIVGQNIIEGPSLRTQEKINKFNSCFENFCPDLKLYLKDLGISQIINFSGAYDVSKSLDSTNYISYEDTINNLLENNIIENKFSNDKYQIYKIIDDSIIKTKIVGNEMSFTKTNPTKYKVNISNVKTDQDIQFLDSFHSQWNLYLNPIKSNSKDCNVIQEYNNEDKNIKECEHTQKFFEGEELSYLWKQPVFEDSHKFVYDYANQWTIDPEYIKANFDKSYYKENPDGSIDIELTLYFKPQSYFYLGIIISGTTLILCLGYLGYTFYRQRKKK